MKFKNLLNTIKCTTLILLACQNGYSQTRGTVDGGGANGSRFQIMESFKAKDADLPKELYIKPFTNFLSKSNYNSKHSLIKYYNFIGNIFKKKMWYIASAGLKNIGSLAHGIPFLTDQFAIQTENEVFIDKDIYDQMTGDLSLERERLILHEIFMGMKILLKQDAFTQCLYTDVYPDYISSQDVCSERQKSPLNRLDLTPKEHSEVRILTDLVMQKAADFENEEKFQELQLIFINAFYQHNFVSEQLRPNRQGEEDVSPEVLSRSINGQELVKQNELYCGHTSEWYNYNLAQLKELQSKWDNLPKGSEMSFKSKYKVKIISEKIGNQILIKVLDLKGKVLKITYHPVDKKIKGYRKTQEFNINVLDSRNSFDEFYLKESQSPKKLGDQSEVVTIEINLYTGEIKSYQVYNAVTYRQEGKSTSSRWFTKFECTNQENLKYKK